MAPQSGPPRPDRLTKKVKAGDDVEEALPDVIIAGLDFKNMCATLRANELLEPAAADALKALAGKSENFAVGKNSRLVAQLKTDVENSRSASSGQSSMSTEAPKNEALVKTDTPVMIAQ